MPEVGVYKDCIVELRRALSLTQQNYHDQQTLENRRGFTNPHKGAYWRGCPAQSCKEAHKAWVRSQVLYPDYENRRGAMTRGHNARKRIMKAVNKL